MKNEHAVALGSIKSERKAEQARLNGKKGGRPRKPMEIPLTQGKVALVDREDFEELSKYKWCAHKGGNTFYTERRGSDKKCTYVTMHREIMKAPKGMMVDHIDGNGLNNTRKNLRLCTRSQNHMNTGKHKNNTSGFKGVTWRKIDKKWMAQIRINYKTLRVGYFDTPEEAYKAYCEACVKYHGEYANFG